MLKKNETGAVNGLAVSLIMAVVLLVAALAFGGWAFSSRQDYKDNTDQKINAAVVVAKQQESSEKNKQFAQASKWPLRTYNGPQAYGSVVVNYPKTWSGYVDDSGINNGGNGVLVDGYFYPGIVPSTNSSSSVFALRFQILGASYSQTVSSISQQAQNDPPVVTPYALPKVPKVVGVKAVGTLPGNNPTKATGTMVILPVRSQTLEIWTDGDQFADDFNNIVLPNFNFSP